MNEDKIFFLNRIIQIEDLEKRWDAYKDYMDRNTMDFHAIYNLDREFEMSMKDEERMALAKHQILEQLVHNFFSELIKKIQVRKSPLYPGTEYRLDALVFADYIRGDKR